MFQKGVFHILKKSTSQNLWTAAFDNPYGLYLILIKDATIEQAG